MSLDFQELMASSESMTIEKMQEISDQESSSYDDGFYRVSLDKAGNGSAVVRFLPPLKGQSPYICYYTHYFKEGDKVYNELCLSTIGQKDPVNEANGKLWNSGYDEDKKVASARKRRANYVANILVIKDPAKPENEGKVFPYRFGKKIKDKIDSAWKTNPGFEDDAVQPFNLGAQGADFVIDQKKKDGYPNYDDSRFRSKAAVYGGDFEKLKKVLEGQTIKPLSDYLDPSRFKSYDELKRRFEEVIGEAPVTSKAEDVPDEVVTKKKTEVKETKVEEKTAALTSSLDDEDDSLEFFRRAAKKD